MTQTTADRGNRSRVIARLVLSVLLAFAPLLAVSGGMPMTSPAIDDTRQINGQMPCHQTESQSVLSVAPAQQDACPHCADEGPASQCHCCGYSAPAGLSFQADILSEIRPDGRPLRTAVTDPMPDSSGDRLYRPPIFHS
jgi:hypothetical protein